tara:strand:+ start:3216 stop:3710 length:495 start_codon:yes stop_codon:yes gene_type:complete
MAINFSSGTTFSGASGKAISKPVLGALTTTISSNGSSDWTDLAGMTVTVTPSSASSRFLVSVRIQICGDNDGTSGNTATGRLKILRDSTKIDDGADSDWFISRHMIYRVGYSVFTVLDHPNTTSSTTYKCQRYQPSQAGSRDLMWGYSSLPNNGGELWVTEYEN